jgi:acyl-CoA thioester hydrolase
VPGNGHRRDQTRAVRMSIEPSTDPTDYDFAHPIRVRFVETDAMGIVHHSNYLAYFEEARVAFLQHLDHPYTEWREAGLEAPVLESFVQYRQPLEFDDVIDVHVALGTASRASFQMAYLVTGRATDGSNGPAAGAADVRATGVTVHGCTADGRPRRLPRWLAEYAVGSPAPATED